MPDRQFWVAKSGLTWRGLFCSGLSWIVALWAAADCAGGDWPQLLGPNRNGVAENEQLPEAWADGQPTLKWSREVGQGYAGPAVVGDRVVLFHRVGGMERLEALRLETGEVIWTVDFPASYRSGIDPDSGPRCVPVVRDGAVYAFGAAGDLHCVALEDGSRRWSRALYQEYRAPEGYFGAGSSPLVLEDRVLVNVGSREKGGLVALDRLKGRTLWQATDDAASYSSPILVQMGEQPLAVVVTRLRVLGVDPATGRVAWSSNFGARGPTVNAATPLRLGPDQLFLTASYGVGCVLAEISAESFDVKWSSDEVLSSQYTTPVYFQGYLYGTHGREDVGRAELRCVDVARRSVAWSVPDFGVAHLIRAGDKLLITRTEGEVVLARANPESFVVLGRRAVTQRPLRSLPALSQGYLVIRDHGGDTGRLLCLHVGRP